ncbi:MAG TPA: SDR family oxidoreductase [Patescibacteria group bacterium]|nr:SDR family oxidoreductase [Patescibacteria group bacterium]
MKILIIGGTVFLGRHIVEVALKNGHEVTLFNRGQHNPELFPAVEKLRGDRRKDISVLKDRMWDAVIDTSAYFPKDVSALADVLKGNVAQYVFISSVSVYEGFDKPNDENSPLAQLPEGADQTKITGETYGALKVLCENEVFKSFKNEALIIRPGLIVGPHDPTGRFTYWPRRIARGGNVLAPGNPQAPVQFIDVRDLAKWIVSLVENRTMGIFNATGPKELLRMGEFLKECKEVLESDADFTWVSEDFLLKNEIAAFTEMPLWIPAEAEDMSRTDISKAVNKGLTFCDLKTTIVDTQNWDKTVTEKFPMDRSMTAEREKHLLKAWEELQK